MNRLIVVGLTACICIVTACSAPKQSSFAPLTPISLSGFDLPQAAPFEPIDAPIRELMQRFWMGYAPYDQPAMRVSAARDRPLGPDQSCLDALARR
ncbi:hypothetical protein [Piscinibacter sp.]|uniref:hypothetical protein n=1 Tax=Piscinibacter sp. TaxID=1903157 RepID=UPI002B8278B9|nr:hypothetical protein [Albitalea sp.]HUG20932.1 hypothetical protein [Albitalea sp.]